MNHLNEEVHHRQMKNQDFSVFVNLKLSLSQEIGINSNIQFLYYQKII